MKTFTRLLFIVVLLIGSISCSSPRRISKKNEKIEEKIQQEAIYYGIDFKKITSGNLSKQYKDIVIERILIITPDEIKQDISDFMTNYLDPDLTDPPKYLIDELYRSVVSERKLAVADALSAFGEGLQGGTADRNAMYSTQIRNQRGILYQRLKEIDDQNRINQVTWEKYLMQDLLNFIIVKIATQENGWLKLKDEVEYITL